MRQRALVFRLVALMLFLPCNIMMAQSYLYATGNPTFGVNIPVENGFINITNGNLHMEFHLATMKQRGALTLDEKLVYDSRIWLIGCYSNCYWWPTNVPNTPYTQDGWRFVKGNETGSLSYSESSSYSNTCWDDNDNEGTDDFYTYDVVWTDPSGTTHGFSSAVTDEENSCTNTSTQTVYGGTAIDASGYSMQDDGTGNPEILDNNGTEVYPQVTDRYGNYFSTDANGNLVDSLGRTPVIVTTNGNVTYYDVLSPNGPINNNGTRVRYTVTTAPIAIRTAFNLSGVADWTGTLNPVQSIQLPDGSSYTFTYEKVFGNVVAGYGELQSVTLPTGGVINYGYANYIESYSTENRWLTSRTVGSNPAMTLTPAVVTFCTPNGTGCQENVTLHRPSGDETVYQLTLNNGAWDTTETHYSGSASSGIALVSVANTYDYSHPCQTQVCSGADYITKSTAVTSLLDADLSTQTQYAYNLNIGKLASIKQWDFYPSTNTPSGTPTRETDYTYAGYDLAQSTQLDSSGSPAAQTTYGYTTSASTMSGVTQHGIANAGGPYLQSVSQWIDASGDKVTTTYAMDDTGMVTGVVDPKNDPATTATYQCSNALPYQVTNALGQTTTYSYDCNSGALLSVKDPNDSAAGRAGTVYQYEAIAGRLQSITYPDNGQTSYSYPSATEVDTSVLATPDPTITSSTILDSFGRPYQQMSAGVSSETTYDANGRVNCVTNPHLSSSSSTDGTTCITTYDGLDRPTLETEQDGNTLTWSYHGNTVTSTNEVGNSWQRTSDAFGELTGVAEPGYLLSSYTYDALGNLKTILQIGGAGDSPRPLRSFSYDWLSRMQSATTPEAGTTTYGYDANSNLTVATSPAPNSFPGSGETVVTNYTYDVLNRLTNKQSSGASGVSGFNYSYFYDTANVADFTAQNPIGRMVQASNNVNASEQYSYDALGRVITQANSLPSTCCMPATQNSIQAKYDLAGNVTQLTYPDGRVVTQIFNNLGQLLSSAFDNYNGQHVGTPYAGNFTYTPLGTQAEVNYGNGVYIHTPYNNRGQMCQVWSSGPSSLGSPVLMDTHIYYGSEIFCGNTPGNNGNISEVKDWRNQNRTRHFGYDSLNRIISFNTNDNTMQQNYTYDSFGNLTNQSGTLNASFNTWADNQLISNNFAYDAAGNAISYDNNGTTSTLQFDSENKAVNFNNGAATYTYQASGMRARKDIGGSWTEYVNFNGQTLAEKQSNGTWTDYIYANGQKIARVDGIDNRIHTQGVFTAGGNELRWNLPIPTNPDGSQYTIQTGDKLCLRQYNNNAVGGPAVFYSDGSMSTWDGRWTDQNGVEMNQMSSPEDQWVYRCADVSLGGAKTGETLTAIGILTDVNTQAGTWDIYYADMAIISTDDTVRTVIGPNPPTPQCCGFQGTGWTQTPTATVEAQPDYAPDNVTVHYFIPDQIGSSWMETSNGGWPMWRGEFYPYGTEKYNLPTANNYKFATLERDSESNLDHATFRQYLPLAGRWISPDPYNGSYDLNNPQSFNRYAYVANMPLGIIDPSGLGGENPISGIGGVGGCIGAVASEGTNPIGDVGCMWSLFDGLFNLLSGKPSYQGSRAVRADNHQIWDEHGGFHVSPYSSITSMIADVDGWYPSGCEFGVCGNSFSPQDPNNSQNDHIGGILNFSTVIGIAAKAYWGTFKRLHPELNHCSFNALVSGGASFLALGPPGANDAVKASREGLEVATPRLIVGAGRIGGATAERFAADAIPYVGETLLIGQIGVAAKDGGVAYYKCATGKE